MAFMRKVPMSSVQNVSGEENYKCRACNSGAFDKFDYSHWVFAGKPTNWTNILCHDCGLISHFKDEGEMVTYADQAYRKGSASVYPPISLPWSTVSFNRWKHIAKIIERNIPKAVLSGYSILDFGGYNGLLARALKQHWGSDCTVADLDQEGLNFAGAMGFKTINLSEQPELTEKYSLITMVHVLEHIEDPFAAVSSLVNALASDGSMYIEVPNLFGFPLIDNAHLSTFSLESLKLFCSAHGLEILSSGYCKTPSEAINYGYPFSTDRENIYVLVRKSEGADVTSADGVGCLLSDGNQLKGKLTTGYGLRGISMAGAYFRLGMSRLLFSFMLLAISLVSLIPMVRYLVTSRSLYLGLKKFQGLFRKN